MTTIEPSEAWVYGMEEAELRQLRRDANSSFREKLIWLEETIEFNTRFARFMGERPELRALLPKK